MFMGEFTHTLDDKGRLTIPVRYREALAHGAVITRGYDKNLVIYASEVFNRIAARADALSPTDPQNRALLRLFYSSASEAVPDRQGRILVPPYLRAYAGIQNDCVIVGVGGAIEVWSAEGWSAQLESLNDPDQNAARFAALNLAPG
jgi:MraZ protein